MRHLTSDELSAHVDRALVGRAAEEAERHLADCETCRESLASLVAQDAALRPALTHDPGESYFAGFAARVEERIRSTSSPAVQRGAGFDLWRLFGSPRALGVAGAVAVVVVGAGLALMARREITPPELRDRDLAERGRQTAPSQSQHQEAPVRSLGPKGAPQELEKARERQDAPPALKQADETRQEAGGAKPTAAVGGSAPAGIGRTEPAAPAPGTAQDDRVGRHAAARSAREGVSADRAIEVQRNQAGEDVPVGTRTNRASPPAPTNAAAEKIGNLRKKLAAEPMRDALSRPAPGAASSRADKSEPVLLGPPARAQAERAPLAQEPVASPPASPAPPAEAGARPAPSLRGRADAQGYAYQSLPGSESRLCGEVRDRSGRPVAGAQVSLADLGRATSTDARGAFCIEAPAGEHGLSVMAVGFGEKRQTVRVGGDGATLQIALDAVPVLEGKLGLVSGRESLARKQAGFAREPEDRYAPLPDSIRSVVRAAQQLEATAAARRSARLFDAAAAGWERALRRLEGQTAELDVRWRLAQARVHAWEAAPSPRRSEAAIAALTGYALRAPAGPDRDQAIRWLNQVRH